MIKKFCDRCEKEMSEDEETTIRDFFYGPYRDNDLCKICYKEFKKFMENKK